MTIIVGNANIMLLREAKGYLEDKIDCKVDIVDNMLVGSIDDEAVRVYTNEVLENIGNKWLKEVFNNEFNWEE